MILIHLLMASVSAIAQSQFQVVDIGFRDSDKYIEIEFASVNGEEALKFRLASKTNSKAVLISKCVYPSSLLAREANNIQDKNVKADFRWIFLRSDYSGSPLPQFYPEFKSLLERANPNCPVQDLERLTDQLEKLKG